MSVRNLRNISPQTLVVWASRDISQYVAVYSILHVDADREDRQLRHALNRGRPAERRPRLGIDQHKLLQARVEPEVVIEGVVHPKLGVQGLQAATVVPDAILIFEMMAVAEFAKKSRRQRKALGEIETPEDANVPIPPIGRGDRIARQIIQSNHFFILSGHSIPGT